MIPHERSLVEKHKDKPFAILGVNSDRDLEQYRKLAKQEGVTWRNFWDQNTEGPIATRWNVHGWPSIFILDEDGVIRARDLRDDAMEKKVVELLADKKAKETAKSGAR